MPIERQLDVSPCTSTKLNDCVQWSVVLKLYCLISECNAASTLFLSAFFWGFVARQVGATSALQHMTTLYMTMSAQLIWRETVG